MFEGVSRSVPPGQKLAVTYQCAPGLTRNSRDWVGLFRVGWTSSRDYYTFEWAPQPPAGNNNGIGSVTFAARRLPPEDGHFYQLCYVSPNGTGKSMLYSASDSNACCTARLLSLRDTCCVCDLIPCTGAQEYSAQSTDYAYSFHTHTHTHTYTHTHTHTHTHTQCVELVLLFSSQQQRGRQGAWLAAFLGRGWRSSRW